MKKIIFLIFSLNFLFSGYPLKAKSFDTGFFLGAMGAYCAIFINKEIEESTARKYIRWTIDYNSKEDKDFERRNYAINYRFPSGSTNECNRLLP